MTDLFIDVPIASDQRTLADSAIDALKTAWDGWQPNDADMEVIQIETLAPMAQNAAEVAAKVPAAIFRAYGLAFLGVPYDGGGPALGAVELTVPDGTGYTIPAGTEIDIDGYAFATVDPAIVPVDSTTVTVDVAANLYGTAANGLTGQVLAVLTSLGFVVEPALIGTTAGGTDPESDTSYQNKLVAELRLSARTLVTEEDYELMGLSVPGVGRIVAKNNGERDVTVTATDVYGEPLITAIKDLMVALYDEYSQVNTNPTVSNPTYTTISVAYTVVAQAGYDGADLVDRIDDQLTQALSPAFYGRPQSELGNRWTTDPKIRHNRLVKLIGNVEGADYAASVTITGTAGSASGEDWTMPGTVALPRPGTLTGTLA